MNYKLIDSKNIINNLNYCKYFNKNIMAMVKANAYGHGTKQIVNILKDKVDFWGVANEKEAIALKKMLNNHSTILVVGKSVKISQLIKNNIHITIDSKSELQRLLCASKRLNIPAYVHIAINTGMNRIGVKTQCYFKELVKFLNANSSHLILSGVFTHCFDANEEHTHFYKQMERFEKFINLVKNKDILIHIGGGFCLNHKIPKFVNMVRVGYYIYGYGNNALQPVMTIKSNIVKITKCKKGEFIGYGKTILKRSKKIAIIPMGYSDGVTRKLSNNAYVLIRSKKCRIIGKICMDMFMIDVSNIDAKIGDEVIVYNNAEYFAKIAQTSPYEILTNFSKARTKTIIN